MISNDISLQDEDVVQPETPKKEEEPELETEPEPEVSADVDKQKYKNLKAEKQTNQIQKSSRYSIFTIILFHLTSQ